MKACKRFVNWPVLCISLSMLGCGLFGFSEAEERYDTGVELQSQNRLTEALAEYDEATRDRAVSSASRAAEPSEWVLEGLPWTSRSTRSMASATSGRTGVVAL